MSLENIYYIGQTIAVLAIIGSLAAIYAQQVQSNKIARIEMSQRVSSSYSESMRELMANPELAGIFRKVMFERVELSLVERTQILVYFNLTVAAHGDAYLAYVQGLVDKRLLEGLDHNTAWYLTAPEFAREWRRIGRLGLFNPDFTRHVNTRFKELFPEGSLEAVQEKTS